MMKNPGKHSAAKQIIPGWVHRPGCHCGSTALSDVMTFCGHPYSEALCFGLGAGLGFYYVELEGMSPSRMFHVRSSGLEPDFFESAGIPFAWQRTEDSEDALRAAKAAVAAGAPVLLRTDLYYLGYYRSSTHFNGHVVVLWGYDDSREEAYLSDTGWSGLQTVTYQGLKQARISKAPPVPLSNEHFVVRDLAPARDLATAIASALRRNATQMLSPAGGNPTFAYGIEGIRMLGTRWASWQAASDWQWCARFAYQVIEKRGTGGGAFRVLYQRFLEEAEAQVPSLARHGLSQAMGRIAARWSDLAVLLKEVSESESPRGLGKARRMVEDLGSAEEAFYRKVLAAL